MTVWRSRLAPLALALASLGVAAPATRADGRDTLHTLDHPITVALRLASEPAPLVGDLVSWSERVLTIRVRTDDATADDEPRRVEWSAIESAQAFELRRRLIDADDAGQWLMLAVLMLDDNDESRADRAFDVARRLSPDAARVEKAARTLHAAGKSARGALAEPRKTDTPPPASDSHASTEKRASATLSRTTRDHGPDTSGAARGTRPWPTLTDEQRAAHTSALRKAVADMFRKAGFSEITPIETSHYLLYSELSPAENKRWAGKLDEMYDTLLRVLEMPTDTRLFEGRCVIVILRTRDRFLTYEKKAMGYDASRAGGVCHQHFGDCFVDFYRQANDIRFQSVLIHETTHAFMYRYRSPGRLPTWANEGLADYVAGWLTPASQEPHEYWQHCRTFVHAGKSALEIMAQSYTDGTWYTDDSYPVSMMLVRFMLKYKPRAFKQWIDDIKSGVDWRQSMLDRFGVTPEVLARGFADDIESERHYTRLN